MSKNIVLSWVSFVVEVWPITYIILMGMVIVIIFFFAIKITILETTAQKWQK